MARTKRRAGNGDGTVYRCRDGRWAAAIWMTFKGGRKKRVYHFSRDRPECIAWLASMRLKRIRGEPIAEDEQTLLVWLRIWLNCYNPNIRASTRTNYQCYIEKHISAHIIGSVPLGKVTTDNLQQFVLFLSESGHLDRKGGLSAKTIYNIMKMLRTALEQAAGNGLITRNPANFVKLPKVKQSDIQVLSDGEVISLLTAASGERYEIGLLILLFCGLRLGELLALRHSSLCEEKGIRFLRVKHSLNRVTNYGAQPGDHKTVLRLGEPKSSSSKRDVPLLPQVYEALQAHMEHQRQEFAVAWGLYAGDPFLISNELGGWIDPTTFRSWFNRLTEKAGIKRHIRVHDLRHTAATMMLKGGATPHQVSLLLGHSSSQITERTYLHPDIIVRADALNHLSDAAGKLLR